MSDQNITPDSFTAPRDGRGYRFVGHTADAKFHAFGATLEEAFRYAALATAALMWDPDKVLSRMSRRIRVSGRDHLQLLMSFLEEILFLLDARGFILHDVRGIKIRTSKTGFDLQAVFMGDRLSQNLETHGDIKAVTYHDMKIEHDRGYRIQVVVDR